DNWCSDSRPCNCSNNGIVRCGSSCLYGCSRGECQTKKAEPPPLPMGYSCTNPDTGLCTYIEGGDYPDRGSCESECGESYESEMISCPYSCQSGCLETNTIYNTYCSLSNLVCCKPAAADAPCQYSCKDPSQCETTTEGKCDAGLVCCSERKDTRWTVPTPTPTIFVHPDHIPATATTWDDINKWSRKYTIDNGVCVESSVGALNLQECLNLTGSRTEEEKEELNCIPSGGVANNCGDCCPNAGCTQIKHQDPAAEGVFQFDSGVICSSNAELAAQADPEVALAIAALGAGALLGQAPAETLTSLYLNTSNYMANLSSAYPWLSTAANTAGATAGIIGMFAHRDACQQNPTSDACLYGAVGLWQLGGAQAIVGQTKSAIRGIGQGVGSLAGDLRSIPTVENYETLLKDRDGGYIMPLNQQESSFYDFEKYLAERERRFLL
ncbi:hypothetical protein KJ965_00920, partial [Patescibacteria group bacterium]|nr:hypothetical protein [Patescibacteria group bacterium]